MLVKSGGGIIAKFTHRHEYGLKVGFRVGLVWRRCSCAAKCACADIHTDCTRTRTITSPHNRNDSPSYSAYVDFLGHNTQVEDGAIQRCVAKQHLYVTGRRGDRFSWVRFSDFGIARSHGYRECRQLPARSALSNDPSSEAFTIQNLMAYDAPASAYLSIGTTGRTRSTRAIWEKRTESSFSPVT